MARCHAILTAIADTFGIAVAFCDSHWRVLPPEMRASTRNVDAILGSLVREWISRGYSIGSEDPEIEADVARIGGATN